MMNTTTTYTIQTRDEFARILRDFRAAKAIRAYGRFGAFGRSLLTTNNLRVLYTAWTFQPNLNIHPKAAF